MTEPPGGPAANAPQAESAADPEQLALEMRLHPGASFDNFIAGANEQSLAAMRALAASERGARPWCVYLSGASGSGKTHLLEALCREATASQRRCAYLSLADSKRFSPQWLQGLAELDFVCLDGLEHLRGAPSWEQAVFALYNAVEEAGGRLAVAAGVPARGLPLRLSDLRSRLGSALLLPLHELDEAARAKAFVARVRERGLAVNDEVVNYIMRRSRRDMKTLITLLDKLDEAAMAAQRRLTIPFVKDFL